MAATDVRSLLRAEHNNRRIVHPNAIYTADGKLHCTVCAAPVPSTSWKAHLHSAAHLKHQSVELNPPTTEAKHEVRDRDLSPVKKKRKLEISSPEVAHVEQKRVKASPPWGDNVEEEVLKELPQQTAQPREADEGPMQAEELAAFEAELALMEDHQDKTALDVEATISAKPLSAEEIAAKATEEQSQQRTKTDLDIEGEREDALRAIEEELDTMEILDLRVKKLKERRAKLMKSKEVEVDEKAEVEDDKQDEDQDVDDNSDDPFHDWDLNSND
ncbi:hypothetical protein K470DRAFT_69032 [Piedraia hortae CBS 480.64]|uniref:Coiled-coil domain-containing protein 16 n=1 Tax=Piedraia hortae CBS 480.64 TaxID=1314780 RepID=A0A6A7BZF1_9PEZI|nr:hypothetical protein K470DRAFT_69032 [Piedraia hortae CBS 480.64]